MDRSRCVRPLRPGERERLDADGPGTFRLRTFPHGTTTTYRFDFEQTFRRSAGDLYRLRLYDLAFNVTSEEGAVELPAEAEALNLYSDALDEIVALGPRIREQVDAA